MANEIEKDEVLDELPSVEEGQEDFTDWKALALKNHGIAKRFKTKFEKLKANPPKEETPPIEGKKGFDNADKALLIASGIKRDEFDFVEDFMKNTGKSLDEVVDSKYFQAELKAQREESETKNAIPSGTKRASPGSRDEVGYWIAKDELPPRDQRELRSKVVQAKIKIEQDKSVFTDNPVV